MCVLPCVHAANNIFFRKATDEKISEHVLIVKTCVANANMEYMFTFLDNYLCRCSSGQRPFHASAPEVEDGAGDPDLLRGGAGLDSAC